MRILLCSPVTLDRRLGAAKVYCEVADGFQQQGWSSTLIGPEAIGVETNTSEYSQRLREYLRHNASQYDVVEYEHTALPYARSEFPPDTLMVARSVLLIHHLLTISIPPRPRIRARLGRLLLGRLRRRKIRQQVALSTRTCQEADLVNVSNFDDLAELNRHGIPSGKVVVLPYALSKDRLAALDKTSVCASSPRVAFVGTFDPRKGMCDLPIIARFVCDARSDVLFRLLGTRGMLRSATEVLAEFPVGIRDRIEVIETYEPEELPKLLADCSVGVFPSRYEGFGFGVLEMLAASIPVIAYRAPGPPMMLTEEFLVTSGDKKAAAKKLIALLGDQPRLTAARSWARQRASEFQWHDIIQRTATTYVERHNALKRQ